MDYIDEFFQKRQSNNEGLKLPASKNLKAVDDFFQKGKPKEVEYVPNPEAGKDFSALKSLERGVDIAESLTRAAFGQLDEAQRIQEEAPQASIPNFRDVTGLETGAKFVAERTLESAPLSIAGMASMLGGLPIAAAVIGTPLLGEARLAIKEEGGEGGFFEALPAAIANTALEFVRAKTLLKSTGLDKTYKEIVEEVLKENKGFLKKLKDGAIDVGKNIVEEGVVETLQELNNTISSRFFTNKEVMALDPELRETLLQSFVGGAAGGGGSGLAANVGKAVVEQIVKPREKVAEGKPIEQAVQDIITEKKRQLSEAESFIEETGQRLSDSPFTVFAPHEGFFKQKQGSLPLDHPAEMPKDQPNVEAILDNVWITVDGQDIVPGIDVLKKRGGVYAAKNKNKKVVYIDGFDSGEKFSVDQLMDDVAEILNKVYMDLGLPKQTIVVGDSSAYEDIANVGTGLGANAFGNEDVSLITIDLSQLAQRAKTRDEVITKALQVATHEFGHSFFDREYARATPEIQKGLLQGYREFLRDIESMTVGEFYRKYDALGQRGRRNAAYSSQMTMKKFMAKTDINTRGYLTSFDEYAAQQFARALTGKAEKFLPAEKAYFKRIVKMFKRLWEKVKEKWSATPTFEKWVESYFLREEVRRLEEGLTALESPSEENKETLKDLAAYIKNERESGQTPKTYDEVNYNAFADVLEKVGLEREAADFRQHKDVLLGFAKILPMLTPIQIAELAKKSGIENPARYMELVREFSNTKMKGIVAADDVLQEWKNLGNERTTKLGNFLYEVSTLSDEKERRLTKEELIEIRSRMKLDDDTFAVWEQIDGSFRDIIERMERGLLIDYVVTKVNDADLAREIVDEYLVTPDARKALLVHRKVEGLEDVDPLALTSGMTDIGKQMFALRERNYFPRTRMGEYVITIKAMEEGQEWDGYTAKNKGETLGFYAFDSKEERDAMAKELEADVKASGVSMSSSIMDTETYAVMGMPEVLIRQILDSEELELSAEQKEHIKNISLNLSPGKRFLKHLKRRKGIAGFSMDAIRVYSNYMMSAANHLARIEHAKEMIAELATFDRKIKELEMGNLGGDIADFVKLKQYYRRHFDYLMKPDNDWATLRSIGFLWYLGFNVKSAAVNLTQMPMVTFPLLSAQFGTGKTLRSLTKAATDLRKLNKDGDLPDDELAMLTKLRDDGVIDESMVMELAGLGEADILKRTIPGWKMDNVISKLSYYGGAMFRLMEKFNRNATALAAYRLAKERGDADPIKYAREAIEKSQFEYNKWNRPEFMRGKKSVVFLFWSYMQHAAFLFFGGEGRRVAMRMWLMGLLSSGLLGLPFAETLLNILNFAGTKTAEAIGADDPRIRLQEDLREGVIDSLDFVGKNLTKAFGVDNPQTAFQMDLREALLEITNKPDLILHGASSEWGLGPLHLLSLMGAPVPNVDISGSLSFGSPVRAFDEMVTGNRDPDAELGKLTEAILGPIGGIVFNGYKAVSSNDPQTWKRFEKLMPVAVKNALQGTRLAMEGKETFKGGGEFLDMSDTEGRVSAIMKGLGFQPSALTKKYRQVKAVQDAALYWTLRRSLLLQDYAYAVTINNREMKADVLKAIKRHNQGVKKVKELKGLGISNKDFRSSIRSRLRAQKERELGIVGKKNYLLTEKIKRLYPVE